MVLPLPRVLRRGTRYRATSLQTVEMVAAGFPAALQLASILRRERIDIIHTNGAKAHLLGGLAGRLAGCRVVWHVRDFPPAGSAGRFFSQALRRFPHAVIANSSAVAESLRALGADSARLVAIANPVDLVRFAPRESKEDLRRGAGLPVDVPLVGMVAHLTPWKGHEQFLQIARRVRDVVPSVHFAIAGGAIYETDGHDGYPDRLRALAGDLGLREHVTFLGNCDVAPLLGAIDVLVHCPTAPEPFGRVLAEAMAAERPVVAARCGGIPEVVEDGATGFLVEPGDGGEFARRIIQLLGDPSLGGGMGRLAREVAEKRFAPADHAGRVHDIYRAVCATSLAAA
jgi:L-malate glycosyltransferase